MLGEVGTRVPGREQQASKRVTHPIAEIVAVDSCPFSVLEDAVFCRLLQDAYPWYTRPAHPTLSRAALPSLYRLPGTM